MLRSQPQSNERRILLTIFAAFSTGFALASLLFGWAFDELADIPTPCPIPAPPTPSVIASQPTQIALSQKPTSAPKKPLKKTKKKKNKKKKSRR